MDPKIYFLGTGGDIFTTGRQILFSGGIIIQTDNNQFHLDPGPGALLRAKHFGINPRNNTAILTSHNHLNHCNDLNAVIAATSHNGLDRSGVLVLNKSVFSDTESTNPFLTEFHKGCIERAVVMEPGLRVGVNNVEIVALPTKHNDPYALGFKFITPKFTLVYSGDTGYDKEVIEHYKDCDVLILNVQNPSGVSDENHLNTDDVIKIISEVKPKLTVMTHFGIKMLEASALYEARKVHKETSAHVMTAKEGMVLNPVSFSSTVRQRRLNTF